MAAHHPKTATSSDPVNSTLRQTDLCADRSRPYITPMTSPTDPRRFLYRADALDPALPHQLAREALAKADDGELYLQHRATESSGYDDGRLTPAAYSTDTRFGLRAVSGEMPGFAPPLNPSIAPLPRPPPTH